MLARKAIVLGATKKAVKIAKAKYVAFNSIKTADWIEKCVYCEQGVEK